VKTEPIIKGKKATPVKSDQQVNLYGMDPHAFTYCPEVAD
jgi:hypothetical protein